MKNFSGLWVLLVAAVLVWGLFITGCSQLTQGITSSTPFYSNAKSTCPEFIPLSGASASSDWGPGNGLYHLFYTLREFLPARDNGVIDRANMYKLLYDVESLLIGLKNSAVTLASPKIIVPPYDFGNNKTYAAAANLEGSERAIALNETESLIEAIVTWIWREPSLPNKMETGVFEASFNKNTYDLKVDFVFSVDYDTSDTVCDYNQRTQISGNAATHAFEYRSVTGGSSESYGLTQMVGKGISKGQGSGFLFKIKTSAGEFSSPRYVVLNGDADEGTLRSLQVASDTFADPSALPVTVDNYKNYVVNTPFFAYADLLTDRSALNQGNARAGTIYLNY